MGHGALCVGCIKRSFQRLQNCKWRTYTTLLVTNIKLFTMMNSIKYICIGLFLFNVKTAPLFYNNCVYSRVELWSLYVWTLRENITSVRPTVLIQREEKAAF